MVNAALPGHKAVDDVTPRLQAAVNHPMAQGFIHLQFGNAHALEGHAQVCAGELCREVARVNPQEGLPAVSSGLNMPT